MFINILITNINLCKCYLIKMLHHKHIFISTLMHHIITIFVSNSIKNKTTKSKHFLKCMKDLIQTDLFRIYRLFCWREIQCKTGVMCYAFFIHVYVMHYHVHFMCAWSYFATLCGKTAVDRLMKLQTTQPHDATFML